MATIHPINCPKIKVKICRAKCNLLSLVMRLVNAMCIVVIQYIESSQLVKSIMKGNHQVSHHVTI